MRCRWCNGTTKVVHVTHRTDGTHRWLRCFDCNGSTRTVETYLIPKPGPPTGSKKSGPAANGSRNGASVLTEEDVTRLRQMAADGVMQKEIARIYGIMPNTVSRIVNRKAWRHIP
jgi:DNA-binding CsgD family transcriptional regulator